MKAGWDTRCFVTESFLYFGATPDEGKAQKIEDVAGLDHSNFALTCWEGLAVDPTANQACEDLCLRRACETAQSNHFDLAGNANCVNKQTCGFDMSACLGATWHQQTIDKAIDDATYWMKVECQNVFSNELVTEDGFFLWREMPTDDPSNNPAMCRASASQDLAPNVVVRDDIARQSSGTVALVTWTIASTTDTRDSQSASAFIGYDLHDCPGLTHGDRCLDLGALRIDLPAMNIVGIPLSNAHLAVYQVDSKPFLDGSGSFSYPPGTLHVVMSVVAGGIPFSLERSNSETVHGQLSPWSDTLMISGLKFDYIDSVIAAQLQIDVVGDYVERGPTAVIAPTKVPLKCNQPVQFRAVSSDPDGSKLKHIWWIPGDLVQSGPVLNVALADGPHDIALLSQDKEGHLDAGMLTYVRTCR